MKTLTCISVMSAVLLFASAGAHADSTAEGASVTVRYGDLDLNHTKGLATLYRRVTNAAHLVCKDLDSSSEPLVHLRLKVAYEGCLQYAFTGAVARINRPDFAAYAQAKLPPLAPQLALLTKK